MKKLFGLLLLLSASYTNAAPIAYQTLAQISTAQGTYTFSNWKTGMSCIVEDKGRIVSIVATLNGSAPAIKKYDSGTGAVGNYKGTFTIDNTIPTQPKTVYNNPSVVYTNVSTTLSTGGYAFSVTTSSGIHNIVLYPSGFYVSQGGNKYLPGC